MFPNPQDALPLPSRPSVERYKKLAKELVKAAKSGDETAIGEWAERWIRSLAKLTGPKSRQSDRWNGLEEFARRKLSEKCTLADAQFVIARSHGFESWPKFSKHVSSPKSRFESAADAIVNGDAAALKRLLREDPRLIRARSAREHGATLLHYTSANGVEGYRQKTPKNIVKIAQILLEAGAEIDATSDVYGGGCTTLGLAATSVWPEKAGVQEALLQILLDHGASMETQSAGNRHSLVVACLANGRPKAAEFLADRGAPLDLVGALGLGRLDTVGTSFEDAAKEQIHEGFRYACGYGRDNAVVFLLEKGMDLAAHGGDGQTPLHWAVIGGHLETVKILLRYKPPLEAQNIYGGTVFGQALWSAAHGGEADDYIAILEALKDAGAKIPELHVPVNARIDAWLARHGSRAEPSWYWFGEKPLG
jgi:ankyrin repeat protein